MELRALRGMPVIAVESGERLGEVHDALIDPVDRRIALLRVRRGGRFRGDLSDVSFGHLQSLGRDAVMVPNRATLRPASEAPSLLRIDELVGLRVVTERGEARGTIDDAEFDPANGTLTALVIAPPGLGGLLGRRQTVTVDRVRTIGRDTVVLVEPITSEEHQAEREDRDGSSPSAEGEEASE
ncbi:MAG: PRC-barrel domain-containing protein [Thermomicrobium sp.]|nr:PRC-barrel domain-containing protein [Thermomicrobium sp.]